MIKDDIIPTDSNPFDPGWSLRLLTAFELSKDVITVTDSNLDDHGFR